MLTLRIDPRGGGDGSRDLFPSDGEFVGAIQGMRQRTLVLTTVPDAVFLDLYAYEVLERAREFGIDAADEVWRVPFWTEALFMAADVPAHAGREIDHMLPVFDRVVVAFRSAEELIAESNRVLGAVRFDPELYVRILADQTASRGWEVEP